MVARWCPTPFIFLLGSRKKVLGDGSRIAQTCWQGVISAPALMQYDVSCSGGGKFLFCGTDLPHTARQNTDLEFGQAEPEPVKS